MNFYLHKYGPEGDEHFHLHHDDINMTQEQAIVLRNRLNELLKMMDAAQDTNDAGSAQAHNSENAPCDHRFLLTKGHVTCIVCKVVYPCAV